jgi:hypothetical protein
VSLILASRMKTVSNSYIHDTVSVNVVWSYAGNFGTLIEHDGDLKLLVEGEIFRPQDDLRGGTLEVRIAEPKKEMHCSDCGQLT